MGRILYLRNQDGDSIVDCEIYRDQNEVSNGHFIELSCTVDIEFYSLLLLNFNSRGKQREVMDDFSQIQELRGWLWEVFLDNNNDGTEEQENAVIEELRDYFKEIADKYELAVVED